MNKRRFLKSLFGLAGTAAAAPVVAKLPSIEHEADQSIPWFEPQSELIKLAEKFDLQPDRCASDAVAVFGAEGRYTFNKDGRLMTAIGNLSDDRVQAMRELALRAEPCSVVLESSMITVGAM